jgi:hypothetical protein
MVVSWKSNFLYGYWLPQEIKRETSGLFPPCLRSHTASLTEPALTQRRLVQSMTTRDSGSLTAFCEVQRPHCYSSANTQDHLPGTGQKRKKTSSIHKGLLAEEVGCLGKKKEGGVRWHLGQRGESGVD